MIEINISPLEKQEQEGRHDINFLLPFNGDIIHLSAGVGYGSICTRQPVSTQ